MGRYRCEDEVLKLRQEAKKFFTEFQRDYDISRKDLSFIQGSSDGLNYALESFDEIDYGSRLDQSLVKCLLKQFFYIFFEERKLVVRTVIRLQDEVELLLEMADTVSNKLFLYCRRTIFTGCPNDLNQLRCELAEFFRGLRLDGRQLDTDIRGIDDTCHDLGKMARKFTSRNYLTCDEDEAGRVFNVRMNQNSLQSDISAMFPDFKGKHDDGRVLLDGLTGLCDKLSAAIEMWTAKLA